MLRLFDADAGLQAPFHQQRAVRVRDVIRLEGQWYPEIGRQAIRRPGGHHADDGIGTPVHPDIAAYDAGIGAIPLTPEPVAQEHHVVPARLNVLRQEVSSERDALAEHAMAVGHDHARTHTQRLLVAGQIEGARRERLQILERRRRLLPGESVP